MTPEQAADKIYSVTGVILGTDAARHIASYLSVMETRIAELEATLDFYACIDHYQTHNAVAPNVVQFDRGAKARAALEGEKGDLINKNERDQHQTK